jgi:hypothetical protein
VGRGSPELRRGFVGVDNLYANAGGAYWTGGLADGAYWTGGLADGAYWTGGLAAGRQQQRQAQEYRRNTHKPHDDRQRSVTCAFAFAKDLMTKPCAPQQ